MVRLRYSGLGFAFAAAAISLLDHAISAVLDVIFATLSVFRDFRADISLYLDRVKHALNLDSEAPKKSAAEAFQKRALNHDLFIGGSFGFGRSTARA